MNASCLQFIKQDQTDSSAVIITREAKCVIPETCISGQSQHENDQTLIIPATKKNLHLNIMSLYICSPPRV